ncbi:Nucleotidyltransferase [Punctularia strigosozonata HHB-11173 SS5]|uniref:Nucleotidyltransferase n=1 Tax=Punctularia strigosozonata (strain HHB-11173) TaxID=741275 RepID=UPI00044178D5|nr:Nucleotidyltransferase [Punctularia strigosozonata HHB-11173 SS5]EIN07011.1 Nucleotidyltransferase [Punctularia strigosozonata HHB-11173 SS5]
MATDIDSPKRRRRRSNPENEDGPLSGEKNSVNASFQDAEDFVPFAPDSDEEEEDRPPVREWDKGKGRERDRDRDGDGDGERRRDRDRDKDRDGDFGRKRERERYGDDGYVNKKQRLDAASRKAPWVADIDWDSCNNVAEMLQRDVEAFIDYISPTPAEDEIRGLIVQLISRAVTQAFPDAQVLPFGSYETKLYLPLGDIDLVIQSPSMAYSDKVTVLHALANTMRRAGITDRVTIVAKAKVPIIKFITTHGRFAVDISLNQTNGVAAGKMINRYLRELPALRGLVMITKAFLSQRSMNEVYTGGLGSYSIVCLAISFLQMHPKIRRGEIDPSKNLGVLVMEFFELYGCYFNYEEVGISLRDGGTYFNKAARGWQDYRQLGLLSIEDPSDPTNDISRGSFGIARVRQTLAGAHGIMKAAAFQQAGSISAKREGRYFRFRDVDREEPSILAHVMGVTQEVSTFHDL